MMLIEWILGVILLIKLRQLIGMSIVILILIVCGVILIDRIMVFLALAHEVSLRKYSWLFDHER